MALFAAKEDQSAEHSLGFDLDGSIIWDFLLGTQLFISALVVLFIIKVIRVSKRDAAGPEYRSVAILVLGDIGRSPRMMYNAQSFANHGFTTWVVAYSGSKPLSSLLSMSHVQFMYISEPPKFISKLPRLIFLLLAPMKVAHQVWSILETLIFEIPQVPQYILVQNPPTIPSLAIVWLVAKLRGSKVIIDWHNLGYTILAMRLGEKSRFVRLAKWFERRFGQQAYAHLFVTYAMRDYLVKEWDLQGEKVVLHDRPPANFHRCSDSEIHDLFVRLMPYIDTDLSFFPKFQLPSTTPFTEVIRSRRNLSMDTSVLGAQTVPSLRYDRPALLVTSTSWTPDEDFSMLIEALRKYEAKARTQNKSTETEAKSARTRGAVRRTSSQVMKKVLPKIQMFVTGKGPLRGHYMRELSRITEEENWEWVRVTSLWLEPEDYPRLLGACDLGVSLHSSSSALDLPMKIVDMFGCTLPVCALDFACLNELVKDGVNGLVYKDADGLANHFETLLRGFPDSEPLQRLRSSFVPPRASRSPSSRPIHRRNSTDPTTSDRTDEPWTTWDQNWDSHVKPLVLAEQSNQGDEWLDRFVEKRRRESPNRSGYGSDFSS